MKFASSVFSALWLVVAIGGGFAQERGHVSSQDETLEPVVLKRTQLNKLEEFQSAMEKSHPKVAVIALINDMFTSTLTSRMQSMDIVTSALRHAIEPKGNTNPGSQEEIAGYSDEDREKVKTVLKALLAEDEAFYHRTMEHRRMIDDLAHKAAKGEQPFHFAILANHNEGKENEFWARSTADDMGKFTWQQAVMNGDELYITKRDTKMFFPADKGLPGATQPLSCGKEMMDALEAAMKSLDPDGNTRFVVFVESYGDSDQIFLPALNVKVSGGTVSADDIVKAALAVELPTRDRSVDSGIQRLPVIMQISQFLEKTHGSGECGVSKVKFINDLEHLKVPIPIVIWNCPNAEMDSETEELVAYSCRNLGLLYTLKSSRFPFDEWALPEVLSEKAVARQRKTGEAFDRLLGKWLDGHCPELKE